jgi:hypothetical protein
MRHGVWFGTIGVALLLVCAQATLSADKVPAIGEQVAPVSFTDIHYLPRSLPDCGEKQAYVVVFTTLDCPVVKRYLPRLKELEEQYRDRGVQFLALNVGADDPLVEVAAQGLQADLAFPVGRDFDGRLAESVGATRTPEVVVLDGRQRLRYRGRIDSQIRLGGVAPTTGREDLKEAIEDVLSGREVRVAETPVDGCRIEYDALRSLPASVPQMVTYHEHIAPLLQKHCQECHRPGTVAPFSLLSYRDAAAHADTIAEVVRQERMPPAFASRKHGDFVNRRGMSADERALMRAWVSRGTPEGDIARAPSPREFPERKWKIHEPDLVIEMSAENQIPASGFVPYQYAFLPAVFPEDTWVQAIEILPGNKQAVHHCNLLFVTAESGINTTRNFITGYVPGGDPMALRNGLGFRIPANSILVLQLHYVTTGEETTDRTSVGVVFAKEKIQKQLRHFQCAAHRFQIPPGAPHYPLTATRTFPSDATGIGMFCHMHLRGKDMTFRSITPETTDILLSVPNYDFNWQMSYRWPEGKLRFAKGTKVEVTAHYDNSTFNPFNPDPTATVVEGDQTFNEMMYGFLFYTDDGEHLDLTIDPKTGHMVK